MTSALYIERRMRAHPDCFQFRSNDAGKSDAWKHFSLIYEKNDDELLELKYFCACNGCRKVYVYRAQDGSSYGTKNLQDHVRHCTKDKIPKVQMTLGQCVRQVPKIAKPDAARIKLQEVKYCADGYHAFQSVERDGLRGLLQTFVDTGAKYGQLEVSDILAGRKAVSRETAKVAAMVKETVQQRLKEPIEDGTVHYVWTCILMITGKSRT